MLIGAGGHDHWGGGRGFGIGAAVGGLLTGAVLLATLPVRAVGEAVAAPAPGYGYAPPPAQVAYAQPAYAPEPVYTNAYVAAPPAYYYAPPRYYAPRYYYGY